MHTIANDIRIIQKLGKSMFIMARGSSPAAF
jgi:hypothetical protein